MTGLGSDGFRLTNSHIHAIVIVHHQRQIEKRHREVVAAIPQDVKNRLETSNVTIVTAMDLQLLVLGVLTYRWPIVPSRNSLFVPGRQGECPPNHRLIGKCNRVYPDHSVLSIELNDGESLACGATIAIRLDGRYHVENVKSMHMSRVDVRIAHGPCKVGIVTSLKKHDVRQGQPVFLLAMPGA